MNKLIETLTKNIEDKKIIKFYRATGEYGFLSNLYKVRLIFEGLWFPSSEHAYQYGKFREKNTKKWAMEAPKPHLLSILAHSLFVWDIVNNWSKIKVNRMYNVLKAKFSIYALKELLLDTGNSLLIENSKTDSFWGIGKLGKGKNTLGKLLMKVREEIKQENYSCQDERSKQNFINCDMISPGRIPILNLIGDEGSFTQLNEIKDTEEKLRIWCTKCDVDMVESGIALDCPRDGIFYVCPSCNCRIVLFKKGVD